MHPKYAPTHSQKGIKTMPSSALLLAGLAAAAAAIEPQSSPSLFDTTPYVDERFQGPQTIPGKIRLAYFDVGGPNVSYHSYDWKNHGSCDLNPCDGNYKNVFRKVCMNDFLQGLRE